MIKPQMQQMMAHKTEGEGVGEDIGIFIPVYLSGNSQGMVKDVSVLGTEYLSF